MTETAANSADASSSPTPFRQLIDRIRARRSSTASATRDGAARSLAAIVSFIYFFPVLWIILTAFKTYEDALAVPAKFFFTPTLDNFAQVFSRAYSAGGQAQNTGFTLYFFNSLFISGVSVLLALAIGTLAAFGFSRYPLKGNDTYLFMILSTRMLPAIVVIIPIFIMFRVTGLAGTYAGIIALYTVFNLPFAIWMMKSFFDELVARRRGCRAHRRLVRHPRLLQDLPAAGAGRPRRDRRLRPHSDLERVSVRAPASAASRRAPFRSPCRRRSAAISACAGVSWRPSRPCSSFRSSS